LQEIGTISYFWTVQERKIPRYSGVVAISKRQTIVVALIVDAAHGEERE
jgi:hypothetical protein